MMTKLSPKKFLSLWLTVLLVFATTYLLAFILSINSYTKSEWWIKNISQYRQFLSAEIETPKIIVISGSNALFGVDPEIIEKLTGLPTLNLASHALLDIQFQYYQLAKNMAEGDIVVLPLEFRAYSDNRNSDWFLNNMMSWGYQDYIQNLGIFDKLLFFSQVPKSRVYQGLWNWNKPLPLLSQAEAVAVIAAKTSDSATEWQGYSINTLNSYGSFNIYAAPTDKLLKAFVAGAALVPVKIDSHFVTIYNRINTLVQANNGRLILTWPVTARNKRFNLITLYDQRRVDKFSKLLAKHSIRIYCNPALFNLDISFFFNTLYHPNKDGASINSHNLATCINTIVDNDSYQRMGFDEALEIVAEQEDAFQPHDR